MISLKDVMSTTEYRQGTMTLPLALGLNELGQPLIADLATMPHLLVAGTTGSGKSVCLNNIIMSLLHRRDSKSIDMVLIDPKRVELCQYKSLPNIRHVYSSELAAAWLDWAVLEQERRFRELEQSNSKHIARHNTKAVETLPYLVIVIDEYANLKFTNPSVERHLIRLAQMGRAVGIHLVLATQNPVVKVISGIIKANFPSRIAFRVVSKVNSRVILDCNGAETLRSPGEFLLQTPGRGLIRGQGAYATETDIRLFVARQGSRRKKFHWNNQGRRRKSLLFAR